MTSTTWNAPKGSESTDLFARLVDLIKTWLLGFEDNTQLFFEIMADEELPLRARALAVGVVLYVRSPIDIIPEGIKVLKVLSLVDDVIVMIIGLSLIVPLMPESRLKYYQQKYEAVARISCYEAILRRALGLLWDRLVRFVEGLRQRRYKKASTEDVAQSPGLREEVFDQTMEFVADLNLDPESLDKELKQLPPPERVIALLASGLDKELQQPSPSEQAMEPVTGDADQEPAGEEKVPSPEKPPSIADRLRPGRKKRSEES